MLLAPRLDDQPTAWAKGDTASPNRTESPREILQRSDPDTPVMSIDADVFAQAIFNMTQGVCLYDRQDRLRLANEQFCRIFNQPIHTLRVGMSLQDMIIASKAAGNYPNWTAEQVWIERKRFIDLRQAGTFIQVLGDGRRVAISHQPLSDGGWVATYEDITERLRAEEKIRFMAHHDGLTQLPNRLLLGERLNEALAQARQGRPCALFSLDLDGFKPVNDRLGHAAGDLLLQEVALRLQLEQRGTDMAARLGGDEFALLLMDTTPAAAIDVANRVAQSLSREYRLGDAGAAQIGVSIGIACAPDHATEADGLLSRSDKALYAAKHSGLSVPRLYDRHIEEGKWPASAKRPPLARPRPIGLQALRDAATMANDMQVALHAGDIELRYQPIVDALSSRTVAFEVTSQWCDPVKGIIPPERFIPAAEESGFIIPLTNWVLRRSCYAAMTMQNDAKISVNLSALNFSDPSLLETVVAILTETGLPSSRLVIELTEGLLLEESPAVSDTVAGLRGLGIEIWLDDFGTGYSNFAYLQSLPLTSIKIDRCFLANRPQRTALLNGLVSVGHACGFGVIAEGVETMEQRDLLLSLGVDQLQGFLFGRPEPALDRRSPLGTIERGTGEKVAAALESEAASSGLSMSSRLSLSHGAWPRKP